jgi:hypothetical protein
MPGAGRGFRNSKLLFQLGFFNVHVFEFAGVEDLSAFETLDELAFFIAGDHSNTRVLTISHLAFSLGELATAGLKVIKRGNHPGRRDQVKIPEIGRILAPPLLLSSPANVNNSSAITYLLTRGVYSPMEKTRPNRSYSVKPFKSGLLHFTAEFLPLPARACAQTADVLQ